MTPDGDVQLAEGQIAPQRFHAEFVALSFLVSLIGSGSTLELINRRTGAKGLFNNALLAGAAATMGGVSIWSMHFVGNRAIDLVDGSSQFQIAFSTSMTVLSFFVPIVVLMAAFVAIGTSNAVSWWRVSLGGLLCGAAVCGMHYLGNASIENYTCVYKLPYLVGSAIIAVAASTIALSMFFIFRGMWANAWWKRLLSALLLAGAVSGMHWCAALGTEFRLKFVDGNGRGASQDATVIVVICLSVVACLTIAGLAIFTARKMAQSARKAQKITLAAAIFDKQGRILVDPDGLIPSTVVTGSFVQQSEKEEFNTDHPHFLWLFQASRNWTGLQPLAESMSKHLTQETNERQELDETHGRIFRGQFCVAALRLAERLRGSLPSAGVLWDQILPTGAGLSLPDSQTRLTPPDTPVYPSQRETDDLAEKGMHRRQAQYGRGSLMFVVRRMQNERDADRWSTAGYRFAEIEQVSGTISSRMQIQSPGLEDKIRQMALYADQETDSDAGVCLGFFGVRARVGGSGFDVMVQRKARNLLPFVKLAVSKLEPWHISILKRFESLSMVSMDRAVRNWTSNTTSERNFMTQLSNAMEALRDTLRDTSLDNAAFSAELINLPNQSGDAKTMLAFSIVVPIHAVANNSEYEFVSLGLFKAHQLVRLHQSQTAFVQRAHRECGSLLQRDGRSEERQQRARSYRWASKLMVGRSKLLRAPSRLELGDELEDASSRKRTASSSAMSGSSSTVDLCHVKGDGEDISRMSVVVQEAPIVATKGPFGGIMVSEVITVDVETREQHDDGQAEITREGSGRPELVSSSSDIEMRRLKTQRSATRLATMTKIAVADEGEGQNTFVDDLFQKCVEARRWHR